MIVETLVQEAAADHIRIETIAPGAISTPINREASGDEGNLERLLALVPYDHIGKTEDVPTAGVFRLPDEASHVTGATLFVEGGSALHPAFRDDG